MAKKSKTVFICTSCGNESGKWAGQCPACQSWNTLVEAEKDTRVKSSRKADLSVTALSEFSSKDVERFKTGLEEFNLVCGGGIVPGGVVLIGGEPGIGKSTLSLQVANHFKTLYVSGEESPGQIRQRAERLKVKMDNIFVSSTTVVEDIVSIVRKEKPECIFIDSIQTISSEVVTGPMGSVSQIRESAAKLTDVAKQENIPLFIIGHITKEGNIAGPKILEHMVDTVLYFEGDFNKDYRILRAFKNRFGSVNEIGLFRMSAEGLQEIKDKNALFLNPYATETAGSAVCAAIEGSRTILFEVQSLVNYTTFSNPRRMADGFDLNRLILLSAVLEKHVGLKLSTYDVFINVAGGFQINETSADLSLVVAIASSFKNEPVPSDMGFLGEISLSGEIRSVSQLGRRLQEFERNGYKKIILSANDAEEAKKNGFGDKIIPVRTLREAIAEVF